MDELVEYLRCNDPENIIAGEDDCNLLILGDGTDASTKIKMLLLIVGCDEPVTEGTVDELREKYRHDAIFKQLFTAGEKMAAIAGIPFVMAGYRKCEMEEINDAYLDSMRFWAKSICPKGKENVIYESDGFVQYLYSFMEMECHDKGTKKEKNKHIADVFHAWSRAKLSSRVVKQDFDAIYKNQDNYTMIEVKRSPTQTIAHWSPYRADGRNYDIQHRFAEMLHTAFYTFHHRGGQCGDTTEVGCYQISKVDLEAGEEWINYTKSTIKAREIMDILRGS